MAAVDLIVAMLALNKPAVVFAILIGKGGQFTGLGRLSEGMEPPRAKDPDLLERIGMFIERRSIGYVVVDRIPASRTLVRRAAQALRLRRVDSNADLSLLLHATVPPRDSVRIVSTDRPTPHVSSC